MVEEKVKQKPPVRVFYQVSGEPLYTAGRDAFVTDLIRRAGAISVTADVPGAWPKYSDESALATRPEAIILSTGGSMGAANSRLTESLNQSPAVLQGRVYKINDDYLTRPGPRSIDGLEDMAHALHPDCSNNDHDGIQHQHRYSSACHSAQDGYFMCGAGECVVACHRPDVTDRK